MIPYLAGRTKCLELRNKMQDLNTSIKTTLPA